MARLNRKYKNGSTIAGTSAGASVMSRYMITGQQLKDTVYKEGVSNTRLLSFQTSSWGSSWKVKRSK